jgi:hypothetical protein
MLVDVNARLVREDAQWNKRIIPFERSSEDSPLSCWEES